MKVDGITAGHAQVEDSAWSFRSVWLDRGARQALATQTQDGEESNESDPVDFTIVSEPPEITSPSDDAATNDSTPILTGLATPGTPVIVSFSSSGQSENSGPISTRADGTWETTAPRLDDGEYKAVARQEIDGLALDGPPVRFTIDTQRPASPVITSPVPAEFVYGSVAEIRGTAEPGATVSINEEKVTAESDGTWTLTVDDLTNGAVSVQATQTDRAGNISESSPPRWFTLVKRPIRGPSITSPEPDSTITDTTPIIRGYGEPGWEVTIRLTTYEGPRGIVVTLPVFAIDSTGIFAKEAPVLRSGWYIVNASQINRAGSTVTGTGHGFRLGPLPSPTITSPASGTWVNRPDPLISGTAGNGMRLVVTLDGLAVPVSSPGPSGKWQFQPPALAEGSHTVTVLQEDGAGNRSDTVRSTFQVDTVAPVPPVIESPAAGTTTSLSPTISGTSEPLSTVSILVDGKLIGSIAAESGTWTMRTDPLAAGQHRLRATATDRAGNTSEPSVPTTIVARRPPDRPKITHPRTGARVEPNPMFRGTGESGSRVSLYAAPVGPRASLAPSRARSAGTLIGSTVVGRDGNWKTPTILGKGRYAVVAEQRTASDKQVSLTIAVVVGTDGGGGSTDDPTDDPTDSLASTGGPPLSAVGFAVLLLTAGVLTWRWECRRRTRDR